MTNRSKSQQLRTCMVVINYFPFGEPRVEREADALVRHGINVDVICLHYEGEPKQEAISGVNIYRLPMRRRKGRGMAAQLVEYLLFFALAFVKLTSLHLRHRYNAVQVHNLPDFLIFAALVPKLTGCRLILDLHDLMPEFYLSRFKDTPNGWRPRLLRWQERLSCRFADHVITVTELWRQTLIKRGVPAAKCTVVMNLADGRIFTSSLKQYATTSNNGRFHIIYHGQLTQRYGIDLLLRALDLVRRDIPEVTLTVHGRGEYLDTLLQLANELGLSNHIEFSDHYVPTAEMPNLICAADVGVVPYRRDIFTDGILPTKLMEYAALGMPAIVARTPCITAYFDETMVEYFAAEDIEDLARCIKSLYHNRLHLSDIARSIQKFNECYNWTSHQNVYVNLVKELTLHKSQSSASPKGVSL
ncbi:MAG TPA: glycosyltransferase family 4 protein [Anaerolineales bacterium]|nr:glycosyltransferase family 4 protein [Anaerolineales bacterium]